MKNRKCKKLRHKKLRSYIPEQKQILAPEDLLNSHEKTVLLIGKPGIGKTSVIHKMLFLWSQKDNRELDYMFYFDEATLSQISNPMSLESLLFGLYCKPLEKDKKEVLQDIDENSENVIIVFDGISTLQNNQSLQKIMNQDLPEAKIVLTCRSELEDDSFLSIRSPRKVYVQGFSKESVCKYFEQVMGSDSEFLSLVLNNQELVSLCHVPMYAFMVAACMSFRNPTSPKCPLTVTEMFVQILRQDLKKAGNKKNSELDEYIKATRPRLTSLMESAFNATMQKAVNLSNIDRVDTEISKVLLKKITIKDTPTSVEQYHAFLHNTVQEFFSAMWLLGNPDEMVKVLQLCYTEKRKHLKHTIPFLCGLLFLLKQNPKLLKSFFFEDQIKRASDYALFRNFMNTLFQLQSDGELMDDDEDVDAVFVCQCLYESQSPDACLLFLEKVNYHLDLSGNELDPHQCCAVSYVISQSNERQVHLSLEDCSVSDAGIQMILRIAPHLRCESSTLSVLGCERPHFTTILDAGGRQMHLPVLGEGFMFRKAGKIIRESSEKISLHLHFEEDSQQLSEDLCCMIFQRLPQINSLRFRSPQSESDEWRKRVNSFLMDLCLQAALYQKEDLHPTVKRLMSCASAEEGEFLLDLFSRVKNYETQTGRNVLPALQPVYQSAPAVWIINLSERKSSLFLEVLKLQTVKKPVELTGWSDEESEVRSFLQCLSYISRLRFRSPQSESDEWRKRRNSFLMDLCLQAALYQKEVIHTTVKRLMSCASAEEGEFLLDLFSHVKNYETQTGRNVLPALQPVYQSAPAVWIINLSERNSSLFLEVLKLQTVKKPVELTGWPDEEIEVRSFLQCLPYISWLRISSKSYISNGIQMFLGLLIKAAESERQTGEKTLELLTSVCTYSSFPYGHTYSSFPYGSTQSSKQREFLLDLFSHVKNYETQTGRNVLPALQPVYQSAPAVWIINLSERKSSLFLEVLKLQTVKKPVELTGWSDEESEVRSFLQCLSYISQLRISSQSYISNGIQMFLCLLIKAAESERQTGEKTLELLTSVCTYSSFPYGHTYSSFPYGSTHSSKQSEFLLDLFSYVKNYETQTGRNVLPALQPVYQSAPAVWIINLSERQSSLFLEVLKLQTVKKPVELTGWSDEESEVRSFLQCLPYISQLRISSQSYISNGIQMFLCLLIKAAESERQTGEKTLELLTSVCTYSSFPYGDTHSSISYVYSHSSFPYGHTYSSFPYGSTQSSKQREFLLNLFSHVKNYETQTGRNVLPALQPVYQSAPAVWIINLSERQSSLFLEVLKLQTVKKPVELTGWSDEESEVRSFLQCLSYISQLRISFQSYISNGIQMFLCLLIKAAESERQTGEKTLELLTSVCTYTSFPYGSTHSSKQREFLLDLFSHVKNYETQTGRNVLPALQPVYQSAPAVWIINLSERKSSLFLEVLKLQTVKKPVELTGWPDEESEVRSFLQCLPYISQLRISSQSYISNGIQMFLCLLIKAAESERQTGEKTLELLTSVCTYSSFPYGDTHSSISYVYSHSSFPYGSTQSSKQSEFLLDLFSHVKNYETQTGRNVLPALQPVYQLAPAVWIINLSERKSSLFLEVLKLQTVKTPVELTGWSDEESEVRSFLQCLPYISQLRGAELCIRSLCKVMHSREEVEQVALLLQALNFTVSLGGKLSTSSCRFVGRVLGLSASTLNLTLNPQSISLRGSRLLFRHISHLQTLRLDGAMMVKVVRALRALRASTSVTVEELSLILSRRQRSEGELSRVLSSLSSLLRLWNVQCVNLTEHTMEVQPLTVLLCHKGSLTIRLSKETLQQLVLVVYETQEEEFTRCFLQKVGGDLTSCSLNWDVIHYFLQFHPVSVDFRKSNINQQNIRELVSVLDRIQLRCVDRLLLLKLLHCCSVSEGKTAAVLLSALQHRLDFSCSSTLDLTAPTNTLTLSTEDCRVISMTIQRAQTNTELLLQDCEMEEAGVEQLYTILHSVRLNCSKALLLQFLSLVHVGLDCVRRAMALHRALGEELDLSQTKLDLQACRSLALFLEHSEGLSELDLSHCQLTDHCLELLLPHLHKTHILDLSNNDITDWKARDILSLNSNVKTVRLFNNRITEKQLFMSDRRFEIWRS
uniref:NACHT domain-containing protein n=1 Tax=Pygocentrus nattereri TaxID=42514 RepID=A0AAR2JAK3_PYGNA